MLEAEPDAAREDTLYTTHGIGSGLTHLTERVKPHPRMPSSLNVQALGWRLVERRYKNIQAERTNLHSGPWDGLMCTVTVVVDDIVTSSAEPLNPVSPM